MIDINELRDRAVTFGSDYLTDEEWVAVIDRLEAAEKERDNANAAAAGVALHAGAMQARLEAAEKAVTEAYRRGYETGQEEIEKERDALHAKIEQMEKQEPVGTAHAMPGAGAFTMACFDVRDIPVGAKLYALPGAQPAPSVPNLDMDALERQNDWLREEVCRLREGLALIADQYEPKCSLLIPSIARTALNATGAYGQKESPESWPTEAMVTAFAELFNVRDQKNTFGPAFRAALAAAAPEAKPCP